MRYLHAILGHEIPSWDSSTSVAHNGILWWDTYDIFRHWIHWTPPLDTLMGYMWYRNWILRKLPNAHNGIPPLDTPPINVSNDGVQCIQWRFPCIQWRFQCIQWRNYPMTDLHVSNDGTEFYRCGGSLQIMVGVVIVGEWLVVFVLGGWYYMCILYIIHSRGWG